MDPEAIKDLPMPMTYGRHLGRLFEPERLFAGTGLGPRDLSEPSRRITVRQLLQYAQNALDLATESDWYLGWAATLSDHFHGPISIALMSAPTLGEGVDAFLRYFPSRIPYMHMQGRREGEHFFAELCPLIDLGRTEPLLVETPLVILQQYIDTVYGMDFDEAALELAYPPTPHAARYGRYFKCPVHFDAVRNALAMPARWRGARNLGHVESSWAHALEQCEATLASSRERETLGELRSFLCRAFEREHRTRPLPTAEEAAAHLHLAPRTLIRRLRRLGTSYQRVVDEFLSSRAQELLVNEEITIKEVAAALGFESPANFGKAFKRWCGVSPGAFRTANVRRP